MRYIVKRNFSGLTRRFFVDMEIDGSEIDGAAPPERWEELGYIEPVAVPAPDRLIEPSPEPEPTPEVGAI